MTDKQWRGERESLLDMLRDIEFGAAMNMGHDDSGAPTGEIVDNRIAVIKHRIADLDAKLALKA